MSEENKIKVNDLPEDKKEQSEEVELPVVNNEEKRGGHSEGGCCGACGGWFRFEKQRSSENLKHGFQTTFLSWKDIADSVKTDAIVD